jgi:hypothetical protein
MCFFFFVFLSCISITVTDCDLDQLDDRLIRVLALQRLQEIQKPSLAPNISSKIRVRAVLYPLTNSESISPDLAHPMPYRTLSIGLGADMDVCLAKYGHCNFVSAKHAAIFFDEVKEFSLL